MRGSTQCCTNSRGSAARAAAPSSTQLPFSRCSRCSTAAALACCALSSPGSLSRADCVWGGGHGEGARRWEGRQCMCSDKSRQALRSRCCSTPRELCLHSPPPPVQLPPPASQPTAAPCRPPAPAQCPSPAAQCRRSGQRPRRGQGARGSRRHRGRRQRRGAAREREVQRGRGRGMGQAARRVHRSSEAAVNAPGQLKGTTESPRAPCIPPAAHPHQPTPSHSPPRRAAPSRCRPARCVCRCAAG